MTWMALRRKLMVSRESTGLVRGSEAWRKVMKGSTLLEKNMLIKKQTNQDENNLPFQRCIVVKQGFWRSKV